MKAKKSMSTAMHSDLKYTMDSVRAIESVKEQAGQILNRLATERALAAGNEVVTRNDVAAVIADALDLLMKELKKESP